MLHFVVVTADAETIKWGTLSPIFDESTDTIGYLFTQPGPAPRSERRASVLLATTNLEALLRRFATSDAQVGATWGTDIDAARRQYAEMVTLQGGRCLPNLHRSLSRMGLGPVRQELRLLRSQSPTRERNIMTMTDLLLGLRDLIGWLIFAALWTVLFPLAMWFVFVYMTTPPSLMGH